MEQDKTVRDLFAEMAVQLERITSETPSIESDDSAVAFVHDSPTPQANTTQDSVAAQGSVSAAFQDCDAPKFDIDPFTTTHPSSVSFDPSSLLTSFQYQPLFLQATFLPSANHRRPRI